MILSYKQYIEKHRDSPNTERLSQYLITSPTPLHLFFSFPVTHFKNVATALDFMPLLNKSLG